MSDRSRVPSTIPIFNGFIDTTDNRLQLINPVTNNPYYVDYNISPASATSWSAKRKNWDINIYPAYNDPTMRTSSVIENVHNFIADFKTFASPLINKIAASDVAGSDEEHIFNFVLTHQDPSHATTAIKDGCTGTIHPLGLCEYEIKCVGENVSGHAHKVVGADSVQYAYLIADEEPATSPTPDDGTMSFGLSTTALFTVNFGTISQGKWLGIYFRWYNTKHPNLAGPWGIMGQLFIG